MEDLKIPRRVIQWKLRGYRRKSERPVKNCTDVIRQDLKNMDTTREEAEKLTTDGAEWRECVAQNVH